MTSKDKNLKKAPGFRDRQQFPESGSRVKQLRLLAEGSVPFLWYLLPAFAAWTAALLVRAIQVLMKRAVDMQTESDLTV